MSLLDYRPQRLDVFAVIGNDFTMSLEWLDTVTQEPVDLSGYTLRVRVVLRSGTEVVVSTAGSDLANGVINLSLTKTQTAVDQQAADWYLTLIDGDSFERTYVNGQFRFLTKVEARNQ
jgi:hypothetical protein